jgi:hypothetical protein
MTPEVSGGLPFFGQDMNGILWMISAYCANFAAGAFSTYNSTLATDISGYPSGAVLVNANGTGLWYNQSNGNSTDPDTSSFANWLAAACVGSFFVSLAATNVTLTGLQAAVSLIVLTGTLTSNVSVALPTLVGQQWVIANTCTGAFTVTVKTSLGTGVVVPATGYAAPTTVYCDSANIQNTGVSTAGLAPINSPALTGSPTAPTPTPATNNTTLIATTAFVQAAIIAGLAGYAHLASPIFTGSPTAPTPTANDNSTKLATTAYVDRAVGAVPDSKTGTFTAINGTTTVSFGHTFATVPRVFVQWNYASTVGFVPAGSITTTGFDYTNANSGPCSWFATTA